MRVAILTWSFLFLIAWPARSDEKSDPPKLEISKEEQTLLDLTNKEREKQKLPPLKPNARLFASARKHTANMARQEKMEHELDGKKPPDRIKNEGYRHGYWGENIAAGFNWTAEDVIKCWMDSKPHRENILNKNLTEIGLGIVKSSKGEVYFTQVFASPQ